MIADRKLGLWHGAPTVILIFKDIRGVCNPDLDCGIAGQNMVLAAHSMGLGTCWVGFAKLCLISRRKRGTSESLIPLNSYQAWPWAGRWVIPTG